MIGVAHYLVVGAVLFVTAIFGIFVNRKNVIVILMSIELMLLAVNINFVAFSAHLGDLAGQVFTMLVLTVAAAEAAIGLAILVVFFRNRGSIEVEDALMSHPAVKEVAVIGIPDEKWGELVTALVVPGGDDVTADELISHCRTALAGYKCPKRVDFVDALPRTATGKLQKFKLREPFWRDHERQVN